MLWTFEIGMGHWVSGETDVEMDFGLRHLFGITPEMTKGRRETWTAMLA